MSDIDHNNNQDNSPPVEGDHGETEEEPPVNAGNTPPSAVLSSNQVQTEVAGTVIKSPTDTTILQIEDGARAAINRMDGWANHLFVKEELPKEFKGSLDDLMIGEEAQLHFEVLGLDTARKFLSVCKERHQRDDGDVSQIKLKPRIFLHLSLCLKAHC